MPSSIFLCAAHGGGRHRTHALYAKNGWLGGFLEPLGLKVPLQPVGVFVRSFLSACPSS